MVILLEDNRLTDTGGKKNTASIYCSHKQKDELGLARTIEKSPGSPFLLPPISQSNSQIIIAEIVKKTGYSLRKLAQVSGIPISTLSHLHSGLSAKPHANTFKNLMKMYCITCMEINP